MRTKHNGMRGRRAHSARYAEGANAECLDLGKGGDRNRERRQGRKTATEKQIETAPVPSLSQISISLRRHPLALLLFEGARDDGVPAQQALKFLPPFPGQ